MADAAVLIGGNIRRIIGFTNYGFNHKSGFLVKFTLNGVDYVHVNSINFRNEDQNTDLASAGYYDELNFLKYKARQIPKEKIKEYKLNLSSIEEGVKGDKINVRKLKVEGPAYTDFCKVMDISWRYDGGDILDPQSNIIIPPPPTSITVDNTVSVDAVAMGFYQHNIPLVNSVNIPSDKKNDAAYVIAKIALHINNIQKFIFPIFSGDPTFNSYITSQRIEWTIVDIWVNPTISDLQNYLNNITEFYNSLFPNQIAISNAKSDEKLYWLGYVLSESGLRIVPTYDKLRILNIVAQGAILGETSKFVLNAINEEELVVKIAKSISFGQENDFLNGLVNVKFPDAIQNITLFELLYKKVNDLGYGEENLKSLMDELHKIWRRSSFYPYNFDGTVKDNLVNPEIYASKPIYLSYESGTILWAFNTSNYDFVFNNSKINVQETVSVTTEHGMSSELKIVGSYGIYQTITIKNTDSNTNNTKFLSLKIDGEEQAALPIFYLKYIDDKKSTENLVTQLELTADLALSLTGVGNIAKLRHIRSIFKLGRFALKEAVSPGILARYELAQGIATTIDITSSLGSIFLDYIENYEEAYCDASSPTYDPVKCSYYKKLDNVFMVMQLFSGVLDIVTSRQLQKVSRELVEDAPDDFDAEALVVLQKFAGDFTALKHDFGVILAARYGPNSPIWVKLNSFPQAKQEEFLLDFGRADGEVLNVLNANNGELVDYWNDIEIENFRQLKSGTGFLKALKLIKTSALLQIEVFVGRAGKKLKKGATPPYQINDYKYLAKGAHYKDAFDSTKGGIADIIGDKDYIGPAGLGYYRAKLRIYNTDLQQFVTKKENGGYSTFFPDNWSKQKVQQEMALAFSNKNYLYTNGEGIKVFKGQMSDSVECIIYIDNNTITSLHPSIR